MTSEEAAAPPPPGPAPLPSPAAPKKRITLRKQNGLLAVLCLIFMGLLTVDVLDPPNSRGFGPFHCFAAAVGALAQATWVTMDCHRRGRPVGGYRFASIAFGPLGLWFY